MTEAQDAVLVTLLELEGGEAVPWGAVADRLGRKGRGRAAVMGSLRRLEAAALVRIGTSVFGGRVVSLTAEGRARAVDVKARSESVWVVRSREGSGDLDQVLVRAGGAFVELVDDSTATLVGPRGLRVRLVAERRLLRRPRIRILLEGASTQEVGHA